LPCRLQLNCAMIVKPIGCTTWRPGAAETRQLRWLLALAAVYDGLSRAEAARVDGMERQTLREWARRSNEKGREGLLERRRAGRPRQLTEARIAELTEIVEAVPDRAVDGVGALRQAQETAGRPQADDRGSLRRGRHRAGGLRSAGAALFFLTVASPAFPVGNRTPDSAKKEPPQSEGSKVR